jgi:hypothetical protein
MSGWLRRQQMEETTPGDKLFLFIVVMVVIVFGLAVLGFLLFGTGFGTRLIEFGALCFGLVVGWVTSEPYCGRKEGKQQYPIPPLSSRLLVGEQ